MALAAKIVKLRFWTVVAQISVVFSIVEIVCKFEVLTSLRSVGSLTARDPYKASCGGAKGALHPTEPRDASSACQGVVFVTLSRTFTFEAVERILKAFDVEYHASWIGFVLGWLSHWQST